MKSLDDWQFLRGGERGKGIGEGMKRKYFQKTYGNEDIFLVNLKVRIETEK